MKKWKSRMFLGVIAITMVLGLALSPGLVKAVPVTLQDLMDLGSTGYQVEDKLFYNFDYSGSGSGGALAPPPSGITVTPITEALNPGWKFTAGWLVLTGQTIDSSISYWVKVVNGGPFITDISAVIAGAMRTGTGAVNLAENVFFGLNVVGNIGLYMDSGGTKLADVVDIFPTLGPLFVVKDILLTGGTQADSRASLSYVENQFSESGKIPEPISLILLGSGLAGAGLYRRLRKPKG